MPDHALTTFGDTPTLAAGGNEVVRADPAREALPAVTVLVVNPNSTEAVTRGIDAALAPLRGRDGPVIECVTLAEGPPGVETDAHVAQVAEPLARLAERESARVEAFVDACFSDPGLDRMRAATPRPVYGIAEAGLATALTRGRRFGIISILAGSLPRHARYVEALGLGTRMAGDVAVGLGVTELAAAPDTLERLKACGERLRDEYGADVVVLGCTGMAPYRIDLERALGIPVIDPTQAAVGMAVTAVRLGRTAST